MRLRIGQTAQQLRLAHGFSQAELADRARITLDALRNLENGNTVRPRTIERVARALGLTPMELYERAAVAADFSTIQGVTRSPSRPPTSGV
jgi:transcriptional regulator with XRE-family HTH domain